MWKVAVSIFLLVPHVFAHPGISSNSSTLSVSCSKVGTQCNREKTRIEFCSDVGDKPVVVRACESNEKCVESAMKIVCSQRVEDFPFVCMKEGEYPDLRNTSVSYICDNDGDPVPVIRCTCKSGKTMNPGREVRCVFEAEGHERKPIQCETGKVGVFKSGDGSDLHYCYYCLSDVKYLVHPCEGGESKFLQEDDKSCLPL